MYDLKKSNGPHGFEQIGVFANRDEATEHLRMSNDWTAFFAEVDVANDATDIMACKGLMMDIYVVERSK